MTIPVSVRMTINVLIAFYTLFNIVFIFIAVNTTQPGTLTKYETIFPNFESQCKPHDQFSSIVIRMDQSHCIRAIIIIALIYFYRERLLIDISRRFATQTFLFNSTIMTKHAFCKLNFKTYALTLFLHLFDFIYTIYILSQNGLMCRIWSLYQQVGLRFKQMSL